VNNRNMDAPFTSPIAHLRHVPSLSLRDHALHRTQIIALALSAISSTEPVETNRPHLPAARNDKGLWENTAFGVTWNVPSSFTEVGTYSPQTATEDLSGYQADPIGVAWVTFDPKSGRVGNPCQSIYVGVGESEDPWPRILGDRRSHNSVSRLLVL
jgi:hypothetical protein